ncbi:hypothetical protein CANCADRAFT_134505 [Tortispora caseinolytica NRRL Y-17796]|uniref:Peptidase S8/S53 domain-containing protein n=1 Tax=Tortispora caseinolytica NRRL Y-17796 TaxID=767744 RepID=A0A1E4TBZ9_9ASCO|nr:hypothetical protein CANCADRAFT_134505 [Tortispora caseinolytica NRRL Y-17796]
MFSSQILLFSLLLWSSIAESLAIPRSNDPRKYIVQLSSSTNLLSHIRNNSFLTHAGTAGIGKENLQGTDGTIERVYSIGNFTAYLGSFNADIAKELSASADVKQLFPDDMFRVGIEDINLEYGQAVKQSGIYEQQAPASWGLASISSKDLFWDDATYKAPLPLGRGVKVYVVDTGVYTEHPEFEDNRAVKGANFVSDESDEDLNGHGTFVSGIIAGALSGIAKDAKIIAVKAFNSRGFSSYSSILAAFEWIYNNHNSADRALINYSAGGRDPYGIMDPIIEELFSVGLNFVRAAGNEGVDACSYIGYNELAITAGSFDINGNRDDFSNYGECVDIWAPGKQIISANSRYKDGDSYFTTKSGSSFSCAHVSGVAAVFLVHGVFPQGLKSSVLGFGIRNQLGRMDTSDTNLRLYNNLDGFSG